MITIRPQALLLETVDKLWGHRTTPRRARFVHFRDAFMHRTATYNLLKSVFASGVYPGCAPRFSYYEQLICRRSLKRVGV
jgi:hypothetical protein